MDEGGRYKFPLSLSNGLLKTMWKVRIRYFDHDKDKGSNAREICEEINDLYARKNHDYGDSFHQTFVEEGMAMARIRLGDKFNRFKTLSRNGEQRVNDESIRDTLIDLANYAIMTVLEMEVADHDGK